MRPSARPVNTGARAQKSRKLPDRKHALAGCSLSLYDRHLLLAAPRARTRSASRFSRCDRRHKTIMPPGAPDARAPIAADVSAANESARRDRYCGSVCLAIGRAIALFVCRGAGRCQHGGGGGGGLPGVCPVARRAGGLIRRRSFLHLGAVSEERGVRRRRQGGGSGCGGGAAATYVRRFNRLRGCARGAAV